MGLRFACFQLFCRILRWAGAHSNPTQNKFQRKSGVLTPQRTLSSQESTFTQLQTLWDEVLE